MQPYDATEIKAPKAPLNYLIIVGLGGKSKESFYYDLKASGWQLFLVCDLLDQVPVNYFQNIIRIKNFHNHSNDKTNAHNAVKEIQSSTIPAAGIITLWEDCSPLAALIRELLQLPGNSFESANVAKSKLLTQNTLADAEDILVRNYSSKTIHCSNAEKTSQWFHTSKTRSLLKLEYGSSAAGVFEVHSLEEVISKIHEIQSQLKTEDDLPGIGIGFGTSAVLTQLHEGTEHDVDIVLFKGETQAVFVSDNAPTNKDFFAETLAVMPSTLPIEHSDLLIHAAESITKELELNTGVFNLEFILTDKGPKVIDINARMGGFYIRKWIQRIWNYDILQAAACCSVGIIPAKSILKNEEYIAGAMLLPSKHGKWLTKTNRSKLIKVAANTPGIVLSVFEDKPHLNELVDEPWGNIATIDTSPHSALKKLIKLLEELNILILDPELKKKIIKMEPGEINGLL